jgi:predicted TIM-barrel fold metal-dependent hydrolase
LSSAKPFIDSLVFVGESQIGAERQFATIFAPLTIANIDKAVLAPQKPVGYSLSRANEALQAVISQQPDDRRQLGRIDPNSPDAISEIRRCVDLLNVSGFYLNPRQENFEINGVAVRKTLDEIATAVVPVVIETGVPWMSEPLQVAEVARRYPHVPFIMTNGGQLNISGLGQEEAFMALRECPNTYIQTAGVYRQDFIETVINQYGANRVLFASAAPVFKPSYEVLRVLGAAIEDATRVEISRDNALKLFWQ